MDSQSQMIVMDMRSLVVASFAMLVSAAANAAESVHFYIKTSAQGHIEGTSIQKGKEKWIEVMSWSMSSPRDASTGLATGRDTTTGLSTGRDVSTGLATGKRQHNPLIFTMSYGRCAQQLYQALCANEQVIELKVAVTESPYKTRWGYCSAVAFDRFTVIKSDNPQASPTCEVSFNFAKIEWK